MTALDDFMIRRPRKKRIYWRFVVGMMPGTAVMAYAAFNQHGWLRLAFLVMLALHIVGIFVNLKPR